MRALIQYIQSAVCVLALFGMFTTPKVTHATELHIAVAANFAAPMKQLAKAFEQQSKHQVTVSYGATGNFYAQIKQGAPYSLLLAADQATPVKLAQEGLAIADTRLTYATGKLIAWSILPAHRGRMEQVFKAGAFDKLAIANPKLSPYGAAAMQAIQALQLTNSHGPKLIESSNIGQAYQFTATGNTDVGLIALSQVYHLGQYTQGDAWLIPQHLYTPIRQDAIVLKRGQHNAAARSFLTFLASEPAKTIIRQYGYDI